MKSQTWQRCSVFLLFLLAGAFMILAWSPAPQEQKIPVKASTTEKVLEEFSRDESKFERKSSFIKRSPESRLYFISQLAEKLRRDAPAQLATKRTTEAEVFGKSFSADQWQNQWEHYKKSILATKPVLGAQTVHTFADNFIYYQNILADKNVWLNSPLPQNEVHGFFEQKLKSIPGYNCFAAPKETLCYFVPTLQGQYEYGKYSLALSPHDIPPAQYGTLSINKQPELSPGNEFVLISQELNPVRFSQWEREETGEGTPSALLKLDTLPRHAFLSLEIESASPSAFVMLLEDTGKEIWSGIRGVDNDGLIEQVHTRNFSSLSLRMWRQDQENLPSVAFSWKGKPKIIAKQESLGEAAVMTVSAESRLLRISRQIVQLGGWIAIILGVFGLTQLLRSWFIRVTVFSIITAAAILWPNGGRNAQTLVFLGILGLTFIVPLPAIALQSAALLVASASVLFALSNQVSHSRASIELMIYLLFASALAGYFFPQLSLLQVKEKISSLANWYKKHVQTLYTFFWKYRLTRKMAIHWHVSVFVSTIALQFLLMLPLINELWKTFSLHRAWHFTYWCAPLSIYFVAALIFGIFIVRKKTTLKVAGLGTILLMAVYSLALDSQLSRLHEVPVITATSPSKGTLWTEIVIKGHNFKNPPFRGRVQINGVEQRVARWEDNKIIVIIETTRQASGVIQVITDDNKSTPSFAPWKFTYVPL